MQKRRLPVSKVELMVMCIEWMQMCEFQPITQATLHIAQRLIVRYDLQIFDSIVAAAALEADCTILYTEDMHHGMTIDGMLTIINPFE
jgi:predicted nucleic acid-binding protein